MDDNETLDHLLSATRHTLTQKQNMGAGIGLGKSRNWEAKWLTPAEFMRRRRVQNCSWGLMACHSSTQFGRLSADDIVDVPGDITA